ncbi:glucuronosyltransferase [Caenorhabditis elegans]|uniref:glucuronosyltransferase n=1 Tax=Caenorhabditis elegans TaxID=6239 RepID=Q19082_CAEEL|nr:glucuronosyltransferase [Caenorhabditis elegans]CCD83461.1 glucuronosyltransferase [Caenorhabditis elegans]|eukprot:NP_509182.1 UDP-GlucuronosylTransferase [Caenorhabditis elegans]
MRILILLLGLTQIVTSLNILVFLLGTNQFERNIFEFLAQQLALRHHNVISIKPVLIPEEPRLVKPKLHLVREKVIKNVLNKDLFKPLEDAVPNAAWRSTYDFDNYLEPYYKAHNASCYKLLNSNLVDSLKKESLDLAIVYSGNPCLNALTHLVAVPTIYFDTEGLTDETLIAAGAPIDLLTPPSHCFIAESKGYPILNLYKNSVCYFQEMIAQLGLPAVSSLVSSRHRLLDEPITNIFRTDYTIKKRFKNFPNVNTLKQQSAAYFVNTDPLLEPPRALPLNVIPVGGLHIDHPKPLFSPWNTTIASAKEGLIIVSFGTQADSSKMSEYHAKAILKALTNLNDYRIYWRIGPNMHLDGIDIEKIPKHINLTTFIPQNDLLAHKSCKLFVTNGGMSSVMEAVAHGVPIVGVPLYGSNRYNLQKVSNKGLGIVIDKDDLNEISLYGAMKKVLESAKYKNTAKEMSKEFKSRTTSPFAAALHVIDHIGRHHSFAYMQPAFQPIYTRVDFYLLLLIILLPVIPLHLFFTFCIKSSAMNVQDNKVLEAERKFLPKKVPETKKNA